MSYTLKAVREEQVLGDQVSALNQRPSAPWSALLGCLPSTHNRKTAKVQITFNLVWRAGFVPVLYKQDGHS